MGQDRPMLECKVEALLQVTQEPREIGRMVKVACMGPGEKAKDGERSAMWLTVQGVEGKQAHALLVTLRKGDRFAVKGRLCMGAPWTTKDGERRDGNLTLWADEVDLLGGVRVHAASADDCDSIPF